MSLSVLMSLQHLADSPPLDILALQRHILFQMRIGCWVGRQRNVHEFDPSVYSRMQLAATPNVNLSNHKLTQPSMDTKLANAQLVDTQCAKSQSKTTQTLPSNPPSKAVIVESVALSTTDQPTQLAPINSYDHASHLPNFLQELSATTEHFTLEGVCYGHWVLIVDCAFLTAQTQHTWHSLVNALQNTRSLIHAKVSYPLVANDYPEYENYHQGTRVLLGFLMRLCYDMLTGATLKFACLTPMSEGIDFGGQFWHQVDKHTLASLDELANNIDSKKSFWHKLHQ